MKKFIVFLATFFSLSCIFAVDLKTALKDTAEQFSYSLKPKSVVAIVGIYSGSYDLSEFMLDELTFNLIKYKRLVVIDRLNLEAIKEEMQFQLSGEVAYKSIQQLGAKIGAQTIIQGVLKQYGNMYSLTIRALNVATATISDIYRVDVTLSKAENRMIETANKNIKVKLKSMKVTGTSAVVAGLQNLFFGLGAYRAGDTVIGAALTGGHLVGWISILAGIILVSTAKDPHTHLNDYVAIEKDEHGSWISATQTSLFKQDKEKYSGMVAGYIVAFPIGILIEVMTIVTGFILAEPYFYSDGIDYAKKPSLKFDMHLTSKGNIIPQISYTFRY